VSGGVIGLALALGVAAPRPAAAAWFADVFVGVASTSDADTKFGSNDLRLKDVEFDRSVSYGGRVGRYFESVPWIGLALDGLNYDANIDKQRVAIKGGSQVAQLAPLSISVTAISFDVMLRLPLLATAEIPNGRLTPYVLGGPAMFVARADDHGNFIRRYQNDTDVAFGYGAGGGLGFMLTKDIGVFGEYRYTHAKPEFEFQNFSDRANVDTRLNTHHFLVGASFKF